MPKLMWILNITPDSFFDGGQYIALEAATKRIEEMLANGVDIIDVWWFSSKPESVLPSVEEELSRIIPVLKILEKQNIPVSVDTCRSEVVKEILQFSNVKYINDISWLTDETILPLIAWKDIWYILMHIQWTPENMQNNPKYEDVLKEISNFFEEKINILHSYGIQNIIIDPWFGFGKTVEQNYALLKHLDYFKKISLPILASLSRKSMIYKPLNLLPKDVKNESVALHMLALINGADILRVHDVAETKNILTLFDIYDRQ